MAKFTENGFEIDGIVEIRKKFIDKANEKFAPLLNGQTLSTDESGVIGRIFGIIAEPVALLEEGVQDFVTSTDPNQATGNNLDDLMYLSGSQRLDSSPATAFLIVFGEIGTTIGAGASARSRITGDVFNFYNPVTFTKNNSNGIRFSVNTVAPNTAYSFTYGVEGKPSTNPPVSILSSEEDDVKSIATRMVQTINSQTSDLVATLTKDNKVEVVIRNRLDQGEFDVSSNMTVEASFMPVEAESATYSAIAQQANTITAINTGATTGWISVTNPYVSTESSPVERDEDARYRWRLTKTTDAFGEYDTLYGALLQVKGVKFHNIQQNITTRTNGERVNQGISVVVLGGSGEEIAQTIFDNTAVGTVTSGTDEYFASDINGGLHSVRISRPRFVPIKISMSLKALPNFPTNGKNAIKQAIVDYFNNLQVGEDILVSRLYDPINKIQGFSVNNLRIGKADGNLGIDDITIKYNELATITPEDILIGGS